MSNAAALVFWFVVSLPIFSSTSKAWPKLVRCRLVEPVWHSAIRSADATSPTQHSRFWRVCTDRRSAVQGVDGDRHSAVHGARGPLRRDIRLSGMPVRALRARSVNSQPTQQFSLSLVQTSRPTSGRLESQPSSSPRALLPTTRSTLCGYRSQLHTLLHAGQRVSNIIFCIGNVSYRVRGTCDIEGQGQVVG